MVKRNIDGRFRNIILRFLARKNKSQYWLADKLGVNRSTVSFWCRGLREPLYTQMVGLVKLGMTANELFGISDGK